MKTSLLHILFILCLGSQMGRANDGLLAQIVNENLTVPESFGDPRMKLKHTISFNDDLPFDSGQLTIHHTFTNLDFSFLVPEQDGNIHMDFVLTLQNLATASGIPFLYDVDLVSIELLTKDGAAGVETDTLEFHKSGNEETTHRFNSLNVGTPPDKLVWDDGLMPAMFPAEDTVFATQVTLDAAENFPSSTSLDFQYRLTIHTVPEPSSVALLLCGAAFCLRRRSLRTHGRKA